MKKVEIEGREVHVSELGKKGEVVTRWTFPANLTYRAAILEHCATDAERAAVERAVNQDDPSDEAPAAKPAAKKSAAKPAKKKKK